MSKFNPVVHFEMPAKDRERMAAFYTKVFGWQIQLLGEEMNNYVLATTSESDETGRPKNPGTINGGFFPVNDDMPSQYPSLVIAIDDINDAMKQVKEAGGQIMSEPVEIQGVGIYAPFIDTEGNRLSLLQPKM